MPFGFLPEYYAVDDTLGYVMLSLGQHWDNIVNGMHGCDCHWLAKLTATWFNINVGFASVLGATIVTCYQY
jgi:hypothetical protein